MLVYQKKLVVSGKFIEIYNYEKPIFKGLLSKIGGHGNGRVSSGGESERTKENLDRTRTALRRLINSNPHLDKFITLTFKKNITAIPQANYEFKKFRQRFQYEMTKQLSYIAVIEFQKRGAVHYHVLSNLDYINKADLEERWGGGALFKLTEFPMFPILGLTYANI